MLVRRWFWSGPLVGAAAGWWERWRLINVTNGSSRNLLNASPTSPTTGRALLMPYVPSPALSSFLFLQSPLAPLLLGGRDLITATTTHLINHLQKQAQHTATATVVGLMFLLREWGKKKRKKQVNSKRGRERYIDMSLGSSQALHQICSSALLPQKEERNWMLSLTLSSGYHQASIELTPPITVTAKLYSCENLTKFPLMLLLLQLPPEWTDQFASGIQACTSVHLDLLHARLSLWLIFISDAKLLLNLLVDHSSDPSWPWPSSAWLLQDREYSYILLPLFF